MEKLLLVTPPFVQVNCPYPATAYLSGYLRRRGFDVAQADLSVELIGTVFSRDFLERVFDLRIPGEDENLERIQAMRTRYTATIDAVVDFLRGRDPGLAQLICTGEFLPQAGRFEAIGDLSDLFGTLGTAECAKFLCTLYLQDLSDLIRATVTEHFEIVRYGERLAMAIGSFAEIETVLVEPMNPIEERMCELLERKITAERPTIVGFTIPFPGCLLAALRCAQYLKQHYPGIRIAAGGGYPSTELRTMSDRGIFRYIDYLILDDGELPLERILSDGELVRTYTRDGYHEGEGNVTHKERGCPDFTGLPFDRYLSLLETTNPMHRLWTDGRWNKMTIAHGCYWAKCAFCDTSLDYIRRYESVPAATFVDWMEEVIRQTGSRSFHFTDEAAPPKLLKEISLEILRRGLCVSWWTNVRFESRYTGDLCLLMAAAGCIAVSGGLEVASDRLLKKMNKGVDIAQAALAMRNFSYAGIMVHAYLMYGFPTQTLQESVDSLEVVAPDVPGRTDRFGLLAPVRDDGSQPERNRPGSVRRPSPECPCARVRQQRSGIRREPGIRYPSGRGRTRRGAQTLHGRRRARPSGSQMVRRENATHGSGRLAHSRSDDPARRIASVRRERKGRVDRSSSRSARGRPRAARRLVCKETEIQAA